MKINIVDTNNKARIKFETDAYALRSLFEHAFRDPEPYVFVFDGKNAKASRRKIYPGYKETRKPAPSNFYVQLDIFKELLLYTNKVMVNVPEYEADDVIASMVMANQGRDLEMVIHSNDGDFARLLGPKVTMTEPPLYAAFPDTVRHLRLYKTLKGDPSDNVKGIRLFGDVAWNELTEAHKANWYGVMGLLENADPAGDRPKFDPVGLGLSNSQTEWFLENWGLVRAYWLVVDFQIIPPSVISQHTRIGTADYARGDALLKEIML